MEYDIKRIRGHYEAYMQGKFICSGDTETEIKEELKLIEQGK